MMPPPRSPPSILIVDDDPVTRSALRLFLGSNRDLFVVGEEGNARDAIDRCSTDDVDIVLMDVQMRGMDGIAATRRITERGARPPSVIILTTFEVPGLQLRAAAAGATTVILKRDVPAALLSTIREVVDARGRRSADPGPGSSGT